MKNYKIIIRKKVILTKKRVPVLSIILFVLAVLLLAFAVWMAVLSVKYIRPSFESGLVFKGYELEILNFFVSNLGLPTLFAILFSVLGWVVYIITPEKKTDIEIELFEDDFETEVLADDTEDLLTEE
jgi:hypothetical protein